LADLPGEDLILCQITTVKRPDAYSVYLGKSDFKEGALPQDSFIRVNKIFTASEKLILKSLAVVSSQKAKEVKQTLLRVFLHLGE
jgi:mRNA interferase MazF